MRRMARGHVGFDNAIHVANAGMPISVTRNKKCSGNEYRKMKLSHDSCSHLLT